jgi:cysteine synthase
LLIWNHRFGNTPLLRLRNIARDLPASVELLVKAEHLNPGGSVTNVVAALALARKLPPNSVVVTILWDGGERYLSERFWAE